MFNVRESLLFAWGLAAGTLAIITYVAAGHPGFGAFATAMFMLIGSVGCVSGDHIARMQGRTVGRVVGVRITVLYFAVWQTFLLMLTAALPWGL